jgi:hypothetical protein
MLAELLSPVLAQSANAAQAAGDVGLPPRQALTASPTVKVCCSRRSA